MSDQPHLFKPDATPPPDDQDRDPFDDELELADETTASPSSPNASRPPLTLILPDNEPPLADRFAADDDADQSVKRAGDNDSDDESDDLDPVGDPARAQRNDEGPAPTGGDVNPTRPVTSSANAMPTSAARLLSTADLARIRPPSRFVPPKEGLAQKSAAVAVAERSASPASRPAPAPARIGSGQLQSARLNWKPGDPFGTGTASRRDRFRWEIMLTTACGTAACGLTGIWLLRALLS